MSDTLPGIDERVIHVDMPADKVFEEETAGMNEHPGSPANLRDSGGQPPHDNAIGKMFLERTGVCDPEGSTLLGRDLHTSVVRNMMKISRMDKNADLYIANSVKPIAEYDNPSLIPGMFPTLFPLGVRGLMTRVAMSEFRSDLMLIMCWTHLTDRSEITICSSSSY